MGGSARPGFCWAGWAISTRCQGLSLNSRAQPGLLGEAGLGSMGLRAEAAETLKPGLQSMRSATLSHAALTQGDQQVTRPAQIKGGDTAFTSAWSHISKGTVCPRMRGIGALKPPLLARLGRVQTSCSAWLTGWVLGDQGSSSLLH